MKKNILIILTLSLFILTAGRQIQMADYLNLPDTPYNYSTTLPAYYFNSVNTIDNTPLTNPITDNGATLGRVLFYDKNLSINRTIACASCHKQANGFSDNAVKSLGFEGGSTRRHSMTLINAKFYDRGRFFWDERAATLENQVLLPIQDATEMGLTLTQLVERVSEQSYYQQLFNNAFGDNTITSNRISLALSQFVRSIVSYQSKYDIGRATVANPATNFANFTTQENQGKALFFRPIPNGGGGCAACHGTEAFVSNNPVPQNNGLDATSTTDLGVGETFTNNPNAVGTFKSSSIRNIELTAPYMHDGRFATLEAVVEHYNSGIQAHPTLSNILKTPQGNPVRLNLSDAQKASLVAFLKTLTDNTIATDVRWSNPFVPCQSDVILTGTLNSGTYKSSNTLTILQGTNQNTSIINAGSGNSIQVNPPFEIKSGTVFKAQIGGCN